MRKYITRQGDMWDMIAFRMYPNIGGERLMSLLIENNSEYADYVIFPAGIILDVPDAEIPVKINPPWSD